MKTPVASAIYCPNQSANVNVFATLENDLKIALQDLSRKWETIPYRNRRFKEMMTEAENSHWYKGPVGTVRHLLLGKPTNAFNVVVEAGRIEWTVEWLIASDPKWKPLLSDWMLAKAKARIKAALAG